MENSLQSISSNLYVETNQLFSSNLNVILTRQSCGQRLGICCGKQTPSASILFFQGARQAEGPTKFFGKEPDVDEKSENSSQQKVPCILLDSHSAGT